MLCPDQSDGKIKDGMFHVVGGGRDMLNLEVMVVGVAKRTTKGHS